MLTQKRSFKNNYRFAIRYVCKYLTDSGFKPYAGGVSDPDRIRMYIKARYGTNSNKTKMECKVYAIDEWKKYGNKNVNPVPVRIDRDAKIYNGSPVIITKKKTIQKNKYPDAEKLQKDMIKVMRDFDDNINKLKYKEFLKTKYWKFIHDLKILEQPKCKCGADKYLQVHHTSYKNHYHEHEHLDDLVVLCNTCHKNEHNK